MLNFVITRAEAEPVRTRIRLLRAVAATCGQESAAADLLKRAQLLENADALCREFSFAEIAQ